MRWLVTAALYLCYIQSFCDYLLTGHYSLQPVDPAGMLWHTPELTQMLARPDGLLLCALFAAACYGFATFLLSSLESLGPWLSCSDNIACYARHKNPLPKDNICGSGTPRG